MMGRYAASDEFKKEAELQFLIVIILKIMKDKV
jgi:hypothetical protein